MARSLEEGVHVQAGDILVGKVIRAATDCERLQLASIVSAVSSRAKPPGQFKPFGKHQDLRTVDVSWQLSNCLKPSIRDLTWGQHNQAT